MTRQEFRNTLVRFFKEHDPEAIRAVPKIVRAFSDQQGKVFDYLKERYSVEFDVDTEIDDNKQRGSDSNIGGHMPDADMGAEPI